MLVVPKPRVRPSISTNLTFLDEGIRTAWLDKSSDKKHPLYIYREDDFVVQYNPFS